jgi:hypothetical protein
MEAAMPNPIDVAKARRAKIQNEIAALQRESAKLDEFVRMYDTLSKDEASAPSELFPMQRPPPAHELVEVIRRSHERVSERAQESTKHRVITATKELIESKGAPMAITDIYHGLLERGINPGGSDEKQALSSILSRSGIFKYKPDSKAWIIRAVPTSQ